MSIPATGVTLETVRNCYQLLQSKKTGATLRRRCATSGRTNSRCLFKGIHGNTRAATKCVARGTSLDQSIQLSDWPHHTIHCGPFTIKVGHAGWHLTVMNIYITFDVEIWCGGWEDLDTRFPPQFNRYVFGRSKLGDYALPKTLEILDRHGLKGVFFGGCAGFCVNGFG